MDKIKRIKEHSNTCLYSGSTNISVMPLNLKSQYAYTVLRTVVYKQRIVLISHRQKHRHITYCSVTEVPKFILKF